MLVYQRVYLEIRTRLELNTRNKLGTHGDLWTLRWKTHGAVQIQPPEPLGVIHFVRPSVDTFEKIRVVQGPGSSAELCVQRSGCGHCPKNGMKDVCFLCPLFDMDASKNWVSPKRYRNKPLDFEVMYLIFRQAHICSWGCIFCMKPPSNRPFWLFRDMPWEDINLKASNVVKTVP